MAVDTSRFNHWLTYVHYAVSQASIGQIPRNAHCIQFELSEDRIDLVFYINPITAQDQEDLEDIVSEMNALVPFHVEITAKTIVAGAPQLTGEENTFYRARFDD